MLNCAHLIKEPQRTTRKNCGAFVVLMPSYLWVYKRITEPQTRLPPIYNKKTPLSCGSVFLWCFLYLKKQMFISKRTTNHTLVVLCGDLIS